MILKASPVYGKENSKFFHNPRISHMELRVPSAAAARSAIKVVELTLVRIKSYPRANPGLFLGTSIGITERNLGFQSYPMDGFVTVISIFLFLYPVPSQESRQIVW